MLSKLFREILFNFFFANHLHLYYGDLMNIIDAFGLYSSDSSVYYPFGTTMVCFQLIRVAGNLRGSFEFNKNSIRRSAV